MQGLIRRFGERMNVALPLFGIKLKLGGLFWLLWIHGRFGRRISIFGKLIFGIGRGAIQ